MPDIIYGRGPEGRVDENNSSSTPLGVSGVFTGQPTEVVSYAALTVIYFSDQPAHDDGISVQFSTDGINWDIDIQLKVPLAFGSYNGVHTYVPVSQYYRIVYRNGTTPQGYFRLQTILHTAKAKALTRSILQPIHHDYDVEVVRSVSDVQLDRANGGIDYESSLIIVGQNPAVGAAFESLWYQGGLIPFLSTVEPLRVRAGGNLNDTLLGTGARKVLLQFLDSNFNIVTQELDLNGALASLPTSVSAVRLLSAEVTECGLYSAPYNVGDIVIETSGTLQAVAGIEATVGATRIGATTIPTNKTAFLTRITMIVSNGNSADLRLYKRSAADVTTPPVEPRLVLLAVDDVIGFQTIELNSYIEIGEKSDIFWEARRNSGGGSASITVIFDLILRDNI